MSDLVVVVPSRGRPTAAAELLASVEETSEAATQIVFAVDDNDPTLDEYIGLVQGRAGVAVGIVAEPKTMVHALNCAAMTIVSRLGAPFAVGFMGDDHRPRTKGWDSRYLEVLRELKTGIVYGDDGFQRERLPTQVAMTADIIRALNYMAPPVLTHMFVDNFW